MARTYLITGANRGIGLELARHYSARGDFVIGTARDPDKADDLKKIAARVVRLEADDFGSFDGFAQGLQGTAIDVLINNAGVSSSARTLAELSGAELERVFRVNAFAPILLARALVGHLRAGASKQVVNISSQLASIANNTGGSSYAYRASKTALNSLTVCLHHELKTDGFTCVAVHPGWVRTDMGGPNAPISPDQSAAALVKVFDGLATADSGKFLSFDGTTLPW